jgi:hypothetical protein
LGFVLRPLLRTHLLLTLTPACSCVYICKFQFRPIHPPSRRLSPCNPTPHAPTGRRQRRRHGPGERRSGHSSRRFQERMRSKRCLQFRQRRNTLGQPYLDWRAQKPWPEQEAARDIANGDAEEFLFTLVSRIAPKDVP